MSHSNRRTFLARASGGVAALVCASGAMGAPLGKAPVAQTRQGAVRGEALSECDRFLGIPFAAPPVGALRFLPPQPAPRRSGILDASAFAPAPQQAPPAPGLYGAGEMPVSEDCLALNIWRPRGAGPFPVYVWVHGGGNVAGSSRMPVFDGSRLARQGIVCVTLSYRVGLFGFLDLGQLLGSAYAGSGNHGLADIVAALRWIRGNIADFGGDPHRVTLGGQSAGAKNVCSLMAMPSAQGLFHGAIIESGGAQTAATLESAHELARLILKESGASAPADLLAMPAAALLAAQSRASRKWHRKYPFRAVMDGVHLPNLPLAAMRERRAAPIPMLIGTARDEIAFFGPNAAHDGTVGQLDLANMPLDAFAPIYARYNALMPDRAPLDRRYAALTAEEYWIPSIRAAQAHAAAGRATWLYRLDMPRDAAPNAGYSVHGSELPLVWDKTHDAFNGMLGPQGAAADHLSAHMHAQWVSFIRHGRPADPHWPAMDRGAPATMVFDRESRLVHDLDADQRRLWDNAAFDFT